MLIVSDVTEVSFQSETQTTASTVTAGLSTKEYIAIAICSLLLGLIYVASVFLYLHVKKRKSRATAEAAALANVAPVKNDQVTFGAGFSRSGSVSTYGSQIHTGGSLMSGAGGSRRSSIRLQQSAASGSVEEMGIIKNNPLLKHYPNLSDNSGFTSDLSNSNSECDDEIALESAAGMMIKSVRNRELFLTLTIWVYQFLFIFRCKE